MSVTCDDIPRMTADADGDADNNTPGVVPVVTVRGTESDRVAMPDEAAVTVTAKFPIGASSAAAKANVVVGSPS